MQGEFLIEPYKNIIHKYKNDLDYIAIYINKYIYKTLEGIYSESHSSKEFLINNINNVINIYIIKDKKSLFFNCDDFAQLDHIIKDNISKLHDISQDEDLVIPESTKVYCFDENIISTDLNYEEIYNNVENYIKNNYKKYIEYIIATINVSVLDSYCITIDSHDFHHEEKYIKTTISTELNSEYNNEKYVVYDSLKLRDESKIEKFINHQLQNLKNKLHSDDIHSGNYKCIIKNNISHMIYSSIIELFIGSNIDNKTSFYKNSLNKQILNKDINIVDKPMSKYKNISYDNEGTKLEDINIVKNGVLKTFILNCKYSKKLNYKKTGNCINSIFIESDKKISVDFNKYIIIEDVVSENLNPTTGDFKFSCSGTLIENSKHKPFKNAVMSFNLKDLINMQIIDDDIYDQGFIYCNSIYLENVIISGK